MREACAVRPIRGFISRYRINHVNALANVPGRAAAEEVRTVRKIDSARSRATAARIVRDLFLNAIPRWIRWWMFMNAIIRARELTRDRKSRISARSGGAISIVVVGAQIKQL
ncbi:hypothetical protein EVAR_79087_1 [Eumeta japonica]|uniref:Uncharacterized protein n=1 Tax=Eumeta variegata TaxID=151549 RepID=A0A4C1WZW9_EUMVA|nr:hypothetical protein EVAR_79087_1 [Eumeta japonica]